MITCFKVTNYVAAFIFERRNSLNNGMRTSGIFLANLPSHATRACLAFAPVPLKYAKNHACSAGLNGHKIRQGRQCSYLLLHTQLWISSSSCLVESPLRISEYKLQNVANHSLISIYFINLRVNKEVE